MNNLCAKKRSFFQKPQQLFLGRSGTQLSTRDVCFGQSQDDLMGISIDEVPERHNSKPKPETSVPHFIWRNLKLWALPDPALFLPTLPFHLSPSLTKDSFHSHNTFPKLITVFKRNHQWLDFTRRPLLLMVSLIGFSHGKAHGTHFHSGSGMLA